MGDSTAQILRDWHPFYVLTGGSAATLLGLVFVAASLGTTILPAATLSEARALLQALVTPIVLRYANVILLGAAMTIPDLSKGSLGTLIVSSGVLGLVGGLVAGARLRRDPAFEHLPRDGGLWHIGIPVITYLLLLASGAGVMSGRPGALDALAAATLTLLGVSIRNTWHLTLWVMTRRR